MTLPGRFKEARGVTQKMNRKYKEEFRFKIKPPSNEMQHAIGNTPAMSNFVL